MFSLVPTFHGSVLASRGDGVGAAAFVFFGSLAAQSQIAALPLFAFLGLCALLALFLRPMTVVRRARVAGSMAGLAFILWLPPLVEQAADDNPNISEILGLASKPGDTLELDNAVKAVVGMVATPIGWLVDFDNPWFVASVTFGRQAGSSANKLAVATGLLVLLSLAATSIRRRQRSLVRDPESTRSGVAPTESSDYIVARLIGLVAMSVWLLAGLPIDSDVSLAWVRWLWAVCLVVWVYALSEILRLVPDVWRSPRIAAHLGGWFLTAHLVHLAVLSAATIAAVVALVFSSSEVVDKWSDSRTAHDDLAPAVDEVAAGGVTMLCLLGFDSAVVATGLYPDMVAAGSEPRDLRVNVGFLTPYNVFGDERGPEQVVQQDALIFANAARDIEPGWKLVATSEVSAAAASGGEPFQIAVYRSLAAQSLCEDPATN